MVFAAENSEHTVSKVTIYTTADILNYNTIPIQLEQDLAGKTSPALSHPVLYVKIT